MKTSVFNALTPEDLASGKTKLTELGTMLPENPVLSSTDRMRMSKISFIGQTFVQEALSFSKNIPELKSSFVDVVQMEETLLFHQQVTELAGNLTAMQHWLDDLRLLSGAAVDSMARACYKNIKTASEHQVESAVVAYDRLKGRYSKRRNALTETNGDEQVQGSGEG